MPTKADLDLINYLSVCEEEVPLTLMQMMDTIFSLDVKDFKVYKSTHDIPKKSTAERQELSEKIVCQLRYFGSNNIAYTIRNICTDEPGVSYNEMLRDVLKILQKRLKVKAEIPLIASVADYERMLCETLLHMEFAGKTEEEIVEALEDSGLDKEAIEQAAQEFVKVGTTGGSIIYLAKLLGKKAVKELVHRAIVWIVAKKLSKEAAERIAVEILKKTTQKTIAKIVSGVGWILLAYDIAELGRPATRITIPCVSLIASVRTMDRLKE